MILLLLEPSALHSLRVQLRTTESLVSGVFMRRLKRGAARRMVQPVNPRLKHNSRESRNPPIDSLRLKYSSCVLEFFKEDLAG
jgi:hypothetical protein